VEESGSALDGGTVFETGDESAPAEQATLERGGTLSRYMLVERVGLGGMGMVWAAYDPELDRKVAIKLLRPRGDRGQRELARTRLLREAQAMARVTHPNVIPVHDFGEHDGQVFLAMEFVQGKTLGRWVRSTRREWREVVAMFVQAGRGLAAAHRIGLVHRDFKPANVLIGPDGRARVTDFGLARSSETALDEEPNSTGTWSASRMQRLEANPLVTPLTRTGSMLGTPAYMAPEQFEGGQFDARTDQFSFCVALWEALHHRRPFAGSTIEDLRSAVCGGKIDPPPGDSRVPSVIDRAMRRGLSVDPAARWPSMDELLTELSRDPASGRRRWLIAGGLVASFCAALIITPMLGAETRVAIPDSCPDARAELDGVWDVARRDELGRAIGGQPDRWTRIATALDDYANTYVTLRNDRCEAGFDIATDPGASCLDHRLRWLAGTVELLASGDAQMIEGAEGLLAALPPIDACARARYVEAAGFAHTGPVRADTVMNARARMLAARARAELSSRPGYSGHAEQAVNELRELLREAEAGDHPPLRIAILIELGRAEQLRGAAEQAHDVLEQAVNEAIRGGYDVLAANAAVLLIDVVGRDLGQPEGGLRWASRTVAWEERIDAPMIVRAQRLAAEGDLHRALVQLDTAEQAYVSALELLGVGVDEHPATLAPSEARIVSRAHAGLAELALARADHRAARSRLADVHALQLASLDPMQGQTVLDLAVLDAALGDWQAAASGFSSAVPEVRERVATRAELVAAALLEHAGFRLNRAELLPDELEQTASLVIEAVDAVRSLPEPSPVHAARATLVLAQLERLRGQLDQAEQTLASLEVVPELEAAIALERGELSLAQADLEQALAQFEQAATALGERPQPGLAQALAGKGRTLIALGRDDEARVELERALAMWDELRPEGHPRAVLTLEPLANLVGPESGLRSRAEAIRASLL
jgi:hypothetical protein